MAQNPTTTRPIGHALARLIFTHGLDNFEKAYKISTEPLEATKQNADAIVRKAFGMKADEEPPEVVYDKEDGSPSFDFHEEVYSTVYDAEAVASLLREAFLISLFHLWERQSNLWINARGKIYDHAKVVAWLRANGQTPDDLIIEKLALAANCIKHGPGRSCDKLHILDNSFFTPPAVQSMESNRNFVQTTAAMLDEMFEAIRRSGPR